MTTTDTKRLRFLRKLHNATHDDSGHAGEYRAEQGLIKQGLLPKSCKSSARTALIHAVFRIQSSTTHKGREALYLTIVLEEAYIAWQRTQRKKKHKRRT